MADVEFEPNDDEMLDLDGAEAQPAPRLRSKVTALKKQKGRGFRGAADPDAPPDRHVGRYESVETGTGPGPQKCERFGCCACLCALPYATAAALLHNASSVIVNISAALQAHCSGRAQH